MKPPSPIREVTRLLGYTIFAAAAAGPPHPITPVPPGTSNC